jgi:hypothetical protein
VLVCVAAACQVVVALVAGRGTVRLAHQASDRAGR